MAAPTIWSEERAALYRQLGHWTDGSYAAYVRRHAEHMPHGRALSDERRSLTWAETDGWSDRVACSLIRRGLPRDAVLATWLPNWIENYLLRLACEKAGLLWLPVPRSARLHELQPLLERSGAAAAVVAKSHGRDHWAELQQIRPQLPSLEWLFLARGKGQSEARTLEELAAEPASRQELTELARRAFQPTEVVMLQPTSGSTGTPKLCEYLLAGATARGRAQVELFRLTSRDVFMATAQGFGPSIPPLLAAPVAGAEVLVLDRPDPGELLRLIEHRRISVVFAVPPIYRDVIPLLSQRAADVSSVRIWYSTGMAMPVDLAQTLERLTGGVVISGYGGVDLGCWAAPSPDDPPEVRWLTAGRPRGGSELRLAQDDGSAAEFEGEVWGRGPSSTAGYYGQPDATHETWTEDGWFRTGDIGRFDTDGNLILIGRKVEAINRGGQKIFPIELEHLLELHPRVSGVAVVGMPDERLGERVCAYVVPRDGTGSIHLRDIVEFLKERAVASYKLPERVEVVSSLPLTAAGKLARETLRADVASKLLPVVECEAGEAGR